LNALIVHISYSLNTFSSFRKFNFFIMAVVRGRFRNKMQSVRRGARRQAMDFAQDLFLSVKAYFGNIGAILAFMFVVTLAVTHTADMAEGAIHKWAQSYPNNILFRFASFYLVKFIGVLAFLPTFLLLRKGSKPVLVVAVTLLVIAMLPEANFYQYCTLSMLLHLFTHSRLPSTRIIVLCGFAIYVVVLHKMLATMKSPREHFNTFVEQGITMPSLEGHHSRPHSPSGQTSPRGERQ